MKVKESSNILNKKKNALPSSKLLKPKKFKTSLKTSAENKKQAKLKLVTDNINEEFVSKSNENLQFTLKKKSKEKKSLRNVEKLKKESYPITSSPNETSKSARESKTNNLSSLFDFVNSQKKIKKKYEDKNADKSTRKSLNSTSRKSDVQKSRNGIMNPMQNELLFKTAEKNEIKENTKLSVDKCKLKVAKVAVVTEGLLKLVNDTNSSKKTEILDVGEPVFLQVECIKIPICPTKQLRFKLPHPLTDDTSDVLLITADLKGNKIFPDKAVEHYEELLANLEINFINKVMPFRMVKKEYSQYEMKRKLVDQFDVILADSRIIKSLPSILGKFVLYKRKMPIPVNLSINNKKLKKHLEDAVCKTQMTVKSNGHCSLVQVGHSKMKANEIAVNIVEVAKSLENMYPGGWRNVRCLMVKTAKSTSLPVYLSLLSPNQVKIPVEVSPRPKPVEDELSTMLGYNVVVTHDGNVVLKKVEEKGKIDDSKDDEILEEAKKYIDSSKTVRYDESSDEEKNEEKEGSDSDDGEAITKAMEKKLMNKYEKNKAKKNKMQDDEEEDEEVDEEDEDEMEEESEIVPMAGKKRKPKVTKKQSGPPAKKSTNAAAASKEKRKSSDSKKTASPGFKKPQVRGTRGGKKNKLSKDQRKALIKRKKAGKK